MSNTGIDLPRAIKGCARAGLKCAFFDVTTTTSGTIDTTNSRGSWGGTIAKTGSETGRYTITLGRAVGALGGATITLVGPDDTALTNGSGVIASLRDDDLASDGTIEVQFSDEDGLADTEVQNGMRFTVMLWFFDSSDN
jgi:hypothetical protein